MRWPQPSRACASPRWPRRASWSGRLTAAPTTPGSSTSTSSTPRRRPTRPTRRPSTSSATGSGTPSRAWPSASASSTRRWAEVPEPQFEPLARRTYVADAIRTIKDMILDGRLKPGQRLPPERALSEALGVSRPTVREAIGSLQAMNILESRHGAGTFVASLSVQELLRPLQFVLSLAEGGLDHLFEVRLLLEPGAARLAADRATEAQVAGLRDCAERADEEAVKDAELMLQLDTELHERIVEASGNPLLQHLWAATSALGAESRSYTVRLPGVRPRTITEHSAIVAAIAAGDGAAAEAAMAAHITRIRDAALARASER